MKFFTTLVCFGDSNRIATKHTYYIAPEIELDGVYAEVMRQTPNITMMVMPNGDIIDTDTGKARPRPAGHTTTLDDYIKLFDNRPLLPTDLKPA